MSPRQGAPQPAKQAIPRIAAGADRALRLSAKSKTRLRLSADGHLVKNVDTRKTWATLRPAFDAVHNDHLFTALKELNVRRAHAELDGIRDQQLLISRDCHGQWRIGLRFTADRSKGGTPTAMTVPAPDGGTTPVGYRPHREDPAGWRETVGLLPPGHQRARLERRRPGTGGRRGSRRHGQVPQPRPPALERDA